MNTFSTAERSERVENSLVRATREYTEAGIEQAIVAMRRLGHRRECPAITCMEMGYRPRSFPVKWTVCQGCWAVDESWSKSLASLFHCYIKRNKYYT